MLLEFHQLRVSDLDMTQRAACSYHEAYITKQRDHDSSLAVHICNVTVHQCHESWLETQNSQKGLKPGETLLSQKTP